MILNWFPNKIFRKKITLRQETLDGILPRLEALWAQHDALIPPWISSGGTYSTYPRHQTMDPEGRILHLNPAMAAVMAEIQIYLEEYWALSQLNKNFKPVVCEMWAQRYIDGVGDKHNHPEFIISGGLYLHISGTQKIMFEHPSAMLYQPELVPLIDPANLEETIELEMGDLLLWPGWMNHTITAEKPVGWVEGPTRITLPFMVAGVSR